MQNPFIGPTAKPEYRNIFSGTWYWCFAVICLTAFFPVAGTESEPLPAPSPEISSAVPGIRAQPEAVRIELQLGRALISWDAGASPQGEVYVSVNGRAETFIAEGLQGSVEADVRPGKSVFTLYGGAAKTNFIGRAVVEGVPVPVPRKQQERRLDREGQGGGVSPHSFVAACLSVAALLIFVLGAIYWTPRRKGSRAADFSVKKPALSYTTVFSALLGGLGACLILDAIVFHSAVYPSLLLPESVPSYSHRISSHEGARRSPASNEILLVGDSRIGRGFSAELATQRASRSGYKFINVAIGGSTPRIWYYLLREIDPHADRYAAIVIPVEYRDSQRWAVSGTEYLDYEPDIAACGPLLHYSDAWSFGGSFENWVLRREAALACLLRGLAYRSDLFDLLESPGRRYRKVAGQKQGPPEATLEKFLPAEYNMVGVLYDQQTGRLTLPDHLTAEQARSIRNTVSPPLRKETGRWTRYRNWFVESVQQRYRNSRTRLIFFQLPRAPIVPSPEPPEATISTIASVVNDRTLLLDPHLFEFLQAPEYFADGTHLNTLGRHEFSEELADKIIPLLKNRSESAQPAQEGKLAGF